MSAFSPSRPERLSLVLGSTVTVSSVAFWRPSLDVFGYPKFAIVVLGVAITGAIAVSNGVAAGRLQVPWGLPTWVTAAFGMFVFLAFLTAPSLYAFVGSYTRHTGALFYILLVCAALLVLRSAGHSEACRRSVTRNILLSVIAAGGMVGGYGVLQMLGLDPFEWSGSGSVVTSTFGNPNFTAALLGVTVPAAAWATWDRQHGSLLRIIGGLSLAAAIATVAGTRSVQGPVTAGVGLLVFALAALLEIRGDRLRRLSLGVLALLTAASGAVGAASLMARGPFESVADAANVELRSFYWSAGLEMAGDRPLTGVGLERYGAYFGEFRSEAAARRLDLAYSVDAAHNVPIQLLATGGLFVGAAYLGFVVLTGVALVRALGRTTGRERLLMGALGGIWAGYQVQSLVSIEVPPLALVHWLTAGAIIAWSGLVELREFGLPAIASRRKADALRRQRTATGVLSVGILAMFVLMLAPLRAGTAAARGSALVAAGRHPEAIEALEHSVSLVPWDPAYWLALGKAALGDGQMNVAMNAYRQALEREPRSITALVTAARLADAGGEQEEAARLYGRALEVEPLAPTFLDEAAEFFEEYGDDERADELTKRSDRIRA